MHRPQNARCEAIKMVDALANRNAAPKITGDRRLPLFDQTYDWSEDERIWGKTIPELVRRAEEAWPELVEHIGDDRYCLTLGNDNGAYVWTVGNICRMIAAKNLTQACYNALKPESKDMSTRLWHLAAANELKSWCKARDGKQLYELQIEACQDAIAEARRPEQFFPSVEARRAWIAGLEAAVKSLRESKRAVPFSGFGGEEFDRYSAKQAEQIRKEIGQGTGRAE